uniref:Uncharacterized protein n=1 Tax=Arundo donax TaxID=35708 RepID=A0A0A8XVT3_ARUDO
MYVCRAETFSSARSITQPYTLLSSNGSHNTREVNSKMPTKVKTKGCMLNTVSYRSDMQRN